MPKTRCQIVVDADAFNMNVSFAALGMFGKSASSVDLHAQMKRYHDHIVEEVINHDMRPVDPTVYYMYGKGNFRYDIPTTRKYKGNRKKTEKPFYLEYVRDLMDCKFGAIRCDGEEADDAIGRHCTQSEHPCVIVGVDKDLLQIPGYHLNLKTGKYQKVTWQDGLRTFFVQCLTGDAADNIPGVPGIGRVKAERAFETVIYPKEDLAWYFREYLHITLRKYMNYVEKNITKEDKEMYSVKDLAFKLMDENASLLWIRKYGWEDWKDKYGTPLE